MRSFMISHFHKWSLQKKNKSTKRNVRWRNKSHLFTRRDAKTGNSKSTDMFDCNRKQQLVVVEEGSNSHIQSDGVSEHEKGATGSNSRWGSPKKHSAKVHRPQFSRTNVKTTGSSNLPSVMFHERNVQNVCTLTNFALLSSTELVYHLITNPSAKCNFWETKGIHMSVRGKSGNWKFKRSCVPTCFSVPYESVGFKIERTRLGARLRVRGVRNFPTQSPAFLTVSTPSQITPQQQRRWSAFLLLRHRLAASCFLNAHECMKSHRTGSIVA